VWLDSFLTEVDTFRLFDFFKSVDNSILIVALGCSDQSLHVDGEFDGVSSGSRPQVVLASFQAFLPTVEMHGGHFLVLWVWHVEV